MVIAFWQNRHVKLIHVKHLFLCRARLSAVEYRTRSERPAAHIFSVIHPRRSGFYHGGRPDLMNADYFSDAERQDSDQHNAEDFDVVVIGHLIFSLSNSRMMTARHQSLL